MSHNFIHKYNLNAGASCFKKFKAKRIVLSQNNSVKRIYGYNQQINILIYNYA